MKQKKPLFIYADIRNSESFIKFINGYCFFRLDVAGVAISTVISEGISAALVIICLCKRNGYAHLELKKIRINLKSLKEMIIIGLPAVCYYLVKSLLKLYTKTNESLDYGMTRLIIICSTYYLCGIMDVMVGGLRGLGYSIAPMIVSIMGACVFRLVWIYTIFLKPIIH
ncbi:MAG: hypothetical protein L6U99_02195 [Clostridium sp.]|nr:MAG: hypothetical protein L6U99_02195 [Clostridium sp.]